MLPGIKYIASEGCAFQSDFEEWGISACAAMCRSEMQLASLVIYPWRCSDWKKKATQKKSNEFLLVLMMSLNVSLKFNDWVED